MSRRFQPIRLSKRENKNGTETNRNSEENARKYRLSSNETGRRENSYTPTRRMSREEEETTREGETDRKI